MIHKGGRWQKRSHLENKYSNNILMISS